MGGWVDGWVGGQVHGCVSGQVHGCVSEGLSKRVMGIQQRDATQYLVELEPDSPRDILLGDINGSLQSFSLGAEPETIVYQLCIPAVPEKVKMTGWLS